MTDDGWSTVTRHRQATTVTPDTNRTGTNQVNNQFQSLGSDSESEGDGPPGLEEYQPEEVLQDLGEEGVRAWERAGIIELARLQQAALNDTGVVQHLFQPAPPQRIIVNPRIENPQAEIRRALALQLYHQQNQPSNNYTTRLGTVVRTFGDDDTVGTVESDDSMSSSEHLTSIDVHLPSDMKVPMVEYNFADFIVYKEQLGNTLARCQHATRDCGHSPIVDTLERHRERTGNLAIVALPPPAQRPMIPRSDVSGAWRRYEVERKMHLQEQHWNSEAIKATERRFPTAVQEQKDQHDALPINYTIRKLLNYIEDKVSDRVDMQKANKTIMQELMKRTYVPDTEGPVKFFKAMEHDVYRIHILKFAYRWDTLIVHCQTTIRDSNRHNGSNLRFIEDEWVRREPADSSTFSALELREQWERFKSYYIKELKKLATDGKGGGVANSADALDARMNDIEMTFTTNMQTLNDNQHKLSTAYSGLQSGVPSVVDTLNDSSTVGTMSGTLLASSAMTDLLSEVQALKQVVSALSAGSSVPGRPSPRPPARVSPKNKSNTTEWRQWKHWCHSCGVNLNHDSPKCKWQRLPDHKDAATHQNPMGGPMRPNTARKDKLWMQWCCPVSHTAHSKEGGD
jgi:hypothetical protein